MTININKTIEKVLLLKLTNETWYGSTRLARVWVFPRKREPYRPYHTLFTSDSGHVVQAYIMEKRPDADKVWEHLLKAMNHPMLGGGSPRRPQMVVLDDADLCDMLTSRLEQIGIRCSYHVLHPQLKDVLEDLEVVMNRGGATIPSLTAIPRTTIPLLSKIFTAAADLYNLTPWKKLNQEIPFELRAPIDTPSRYIVITGGIGVAQGLSINDSLSDLQLMFSNLKPKKLADSINWLTLVYDHPSNLSFDDLEAIQKYGLIVANEQAYPAIARIGMPRGSHPPSIHDLFWLECALPALVQFFTLDFEEDSKPYQLNVERTYTIETLNGPEQVWLRVPVEIEY